MKKSPRLLIAIGFIVAICLPAASILLPVSVAEVENRRLESPEVTPSQLLNPEFYREAFVYVRDTNPVRVSLIRMAATVDLELFDDSPDPLRVFKGLDDWLFFRNTISQGCSTSPSVVGANVEEFITRLERDIGTVVFTIAPSKFSIHPEKLTNSQFRLTECARRNSNELRELLARAEFQHYVDGWEIFEKLRRGGKQPYFRTDTHFNFEASIPWMEEIVTEIRPIWEPEAVIDSGIVDFQGNLMGFLGLTRGESVKRLAVSRNSLSTPPLPVEALFDENLRRYEFPAGDNEYIEGQTVIVGDSFMDLPEKSLVQYFENVTVIDWRDSGAVEFFLTNAHDFDVAVIEVSAMDVWRLFADDALLRGYSEGRSP